MHSPNIFPSPTMNFRRGSDFRYTESKSPKEPSTKILQSILFNFAQSNYVNNSPRIDGNSIHASPVRPRSTSRDSFPGADSSRNIHNDPNRQRPLHNINIVGHHVPRADDVTRADESSRQRFGPLDDSTRQRTQVDEVNAHRSPRAEPSRTPPYIHPAQRGLQFTSPHYQVNPYEQQNLPRYYQAPSATVTTQQRSRESTQSHSDNYLSPRNRSSSIGSAGSSFRDSRSPSHDSTASRDSMSRCSPMSIGSSPSPSPPSLENGSKLFGILKGGTYNYPYIPASITPSSATTVLQTNTRRHSVTSTPVYVIPPKSPVTEEEDFHYSPFNRPSSSEKRSISDLQDEPIDLSVKPKRQRLESNELVYSPSVDSGWGSDYFASSAAEENKDAAIEVAPRRSILESILCGKLSNTRGLSESNSNSPIPKAATPVSYCQQFASVKQELPNYCSGGTSPASTPSPAGAPDSPCSVRSLHSMPPSPVPSFGSQMSAVSAKIRCPWRQKVTLAKKNLLPVSARVSDWLTKIIEFAKSQPEFCGLPETDKVTLMQQCWTRLMLLYMAETNFQFAVTPVHEETDDGRPPAISGIDPTEPTMDSVELVQNFIKKCQTLHVDTEEFKCLKMYTMFHSGCSGLENSDFVDKISSKARQALQDHVRESRPHDKLRYSNLLLYLHTLFGVNCGMVQTLFCKHVTKNNDIDQQVEAMVLNHDSLPHEDPCIERYRKRSKSVEK